MSSAIRFSLDHTKILSSGNGLTAVADDISDVLLFTSILTFSNNVLNKASYPGLLIFGLCGKN